MVPKIMIVPAYRTGVEIQTLKGEIINTILMYMGLNPLWFWEDSI